MLHQETPQESEAVLIPMATSDTCPAELYGILKQAIGKCAQVEAR
jgi:hypothetical protein